MSNSNFTLGNPALVSSVPSPPGCPAEGGERVKGRTGSDLWMGMRGVEGGGGVPCKHKRKEKETKKKRKKKSMPSRNKLRPVGRTLLAFAIKSVMDGCLLYLVASHAVLLAEGPAVLEPAQLGPGAASRRAAELDRVGGRHGVQLLLHLGRRGPVRSPCDAGGREELVTGLQHSQVAVRASLLRLIWEQCEVGGGVGVGCRNGS